MDRDEKNMKVLQSVLAKYAVSFVQSKWTKE